PLQAMRETLRSGDLGMFDALALETTVVPQEVPHAPGVVMTTLVSRPIPSALWTKKPMAPDDQVNRALWPDRYEATTYLPTFSALGEAYVDSGMVGVIAAMGIFGLLSRSLFEYYKRSAGNRLTSLLYALSLPL